ncbi:integrin beta-PS-like protein [Leptotrombidium deliense]|uniref:Integrin beta n=1 Tax=Leptotrombidium deliense TaxID=299467 RepID=A0A443RXE4_9ACAR|nr:integrin beta-PS-like protein [Leptotrombidium deliense]
MLRCGRICKTTCVTKGVQKKFVIIKRNYRQCHLDAKGYYTESIYQDYPSLDQINRAIVDNKINVIFKVPHEEIGVNNTLSSLIDGSVAGQLSEVASNVQLIQNNYKLQESIKSVITNK